MYNKILEYLKAHEGPLDSEDAVLEWWQGLEGAASSLDDLTEALEYLEDHGSIEKQQVEKELFIYRILTKA